MQFIYKHLRNFKENTRGAITLELVTLTPLLVVWIVGSNSFFDGFKTYLRASKATYTAVDLVSRQTVVDDAYITVVGSVFDAIVDADGTLPSIVVSSIEMANDDMSIGWSVATNNATPLTSVNNIPDSFIPVLMDGETVILIQSAVPFVPKYSWGSLTAKTFSNTVAVTPRFGAKISNTSQP